MAGWRARAWRAFDRRTHQYLNFTTVFFGEKYSEEEPALAVPAVSPGKRYLLRARLRDSGRSRHRGAGGCAGGALRKSRQVRPGPRRIGSRGSNRTAPSPQLRVLTTSVSTPSRGASWAGGCRTRFVPTWRSTRSSRPCTTARGALTTPCSTTVIVSPIPPSATPSAWPKPASSNRWGALAIRTIVSMLRAAGQCELPGASGT